MFATIRAFIDHLITVLAGTWPASEPPEARHTAAHTALEALDPTDMIEAMLTARMIAAHNACMDGFSRAMLPEVSNTDAIRLRASAATAGRTFDAALRMLHKHRAPSPVARSRPAAAPRHMFASASHESRHNENPLEGFTPQEVADAEYALDNDPIEIARAELAQRIPLHRCHDMTMAERRIAHAPPSPRTPAQRAVTEARMMASARQRAEAMAA